MNQKVARIAYLLSMSRSTIDAATSAYADVYKLKNDNDQSFNLNGNIAVWWKSKTDFDKDW